MNNQWIKKTKIQIVDGRYWLNWICKKKNTYIQWSDQLSSAQLIVCGSNVKKIEWKKLWQKSEKEKKTENQTAKKNNNNSTMSQDTRDPRHTHTHIQTLSP